MKFNFDPTYTNLPSVFYQSALPDAPDKPTLLFFNHTLANDLGLNQQLDKMLLAELFSGKKLPDNANPIALAYAGHQFGHFVPLLGDGRAVLLGEILAPNQKRYDLQLKGSGQTPYSRRGDGKSSIGPVIREYIVSEAMHALGIPTTRSLAAVATGEDVYREETLPGGVLTRVASSHLRVGTFELMASQGNIEHLKLLVDYAVDRHYPHLKDHPEKAFAFLDAVIINQVQLVANWMGVGFIHGVMNTDNTSISGETLDYGPCAFMDEFNRHQVFSFIDRNGRYAYSNQGKIIQWNMARLAECLVPLVGEDQESSVKKLTERLQQMDQEFHRAYCQVMGRKLGFKNVGPAEQAVIAQWLEYLESNRLDFTNSFRQLPHLLISNDIDPKLNQWIEEWKSLIGDQQEAIELMNHHNPVIIPRNHLIQKAIDQYLNGNHQFMHELHANLGNPYSSQDKNPEFLTTPKTNERIQNTFCGT